MLESMYDGYEWMDKWITRAKSYEEALKSAKAFDFVHRNSGETQEIKVVKEITKSKFDVLLEFLHEF